MMKARRASRVPAMRARLCILHGPECLWAGGDGTLERKIAWLVTAIHSEHDDTDEDLFMAAEVNLVNDRAETCRQATERDRQMGIGIFSDATVEPFDPAVLALVKEHRTPEQVAHLARLRALEETWMNQKEAS